MTDIALDTDLASVVAALAAADRVFIATHENPDGDAIGSMTAAAGAIRHWARRCAPTSSPSRASRTRSRSSTSTGSSDRRPGVARGLDAARARLRQRAPPRRPVPRPALALLAGDRRRPPPRQQPLRRREPDRRQRVVDRRDPRADLRRPRSRDHARHRGVALRRARDRHRAVPVPHHQPGGAAAGRAAGRGRRRRAQGVRAGVRERPAGQAAVARPRDRARRVLLRRAPPDLAREPRRPRARRGRRGDHRGPDRPPARGRGRAGGGPHPRAGAARRRQLRAEPGIAALARPDRRLARSRGCRRAAGTSRRPGSPIRAASTTSAGSSCRRSAPSSPSPAA